MIKRGGSLRPVRQVNAFLEERPNQTVLWVSGVRTLPTTNARITSKDHHATFSKVRVVRNQTAHAILPPDQISGRRRSEPAKVAELADAPDLGSGTERCGGSSPPFRTKFSTWFFALCALSMT
jgi:hypothetical protein